MPLYKEYDLTELETQYDIEATVDDLDQYRLEYTAASEETTNSSSPQLDVAYGDHTLQKLDIFPAEKPNAPIVVYIHGGYWLRGDKLPYRFPAQVFNGENVNWITLNYRLADEVNLGEIVKDVRNAIAWVSKNVQSFGGDHNRLYVIGSSAGGHLAGMLAANGWQADYDLPADTVKGIAAFSGLYDLEPFRYTSQKNYLNLSPEDVAQNSPIQHLPRSDLPMLLGWAGKETDEFQRQSKDYAERCKSAGNVVGTLYYPEHNHFSLAQELGKKDSTIVQSILGMIE